MQEIHFERFWESTLSPVTPPDVIAHWREHELTAVQRGNEIVVHLEAFTPLEGKRVLDLGCGYGGVAVAVARRGADVVGTDFDAQRLQGATIRVRDDHPTCQVQLVRSAAENLPFAPAVFDIVLSSSVLEHVQSHTQTLAEIARVLRPGGWLYLQFPNRFSLQNLKKDPHYGLVGASVLPPGLGEFYVVNLRGRSHSYDVGTFPVAGRVIRTLAELGIRTVRWLPAPQRNIGWLTPVLHAYRLNTVATAVVIGRKL